jgi:hypothetical protein
VKEGEAMTANKTAGSVGSVPVMPVMKTTAFKATVACNNNLVK